ncbi:MAG: Xaa-Pro aminopeptidase, partial [Nitrosopumilales archaeon CG_4_9_14_0_8_um_filter_34_10]
MKERRKNLLKFAQKIGCDTLIAFEPENLFYMTGFWGEAIGMLEKEGKTTIIAPELEVGRVKEESENCDIITAERGMGLISSLTNKIKKNTVCT